MKWMVILSIMSAALVCAYGAPAVPPQTQNVDWKAVDNQLDELEEGLSGFAMRVLFAAADAESFSSEVESRLAEHTEASGEGLDKVFEALRSAAGNKTLTVSQAQMNLGDIKGNIDTFWTAVQPDMRTLFPNEPYDFNSSSYRDIKKIIDKSSANLILLLSGSRPSSRVK